MALERSPGATKQINLGSGKGYSIRKVVDIVTDLMEPKPEVIWDSSKPSGDNKRVSDISRAKELLGWEPRISLEEGIRDVMEWYRENRDTPDDRYNVFVEGIRS